MKKRSMVISLLIVSIGLNLIVGYRTLKSKEVVLMGTYQVVSFGETNYSSSKIYTLAVNQEHNALFYDEENNPIFEGKLQPTKHLEQINIQLNHKNYYLEDKDGNLHYLSFYDNYVSFNLKSEIEKGSITFHLLKIMEIPAYLISE